MFDNVFSQLATAFSGVYGGPYHNAIVTSYGEPVLDDGGSIVTPGLRSDRPCKVQVDAVTDKMRNDANYQDKDVRLFVLSATLAGELDSDCTVDIKEGPHKGAWMVASINRDPVAIGWECLGRKL